MNEKGFDIAGILSGKEDLQASGWLEESCRLPEAFWESLYDYHAKEIGPSLKSILFQGYDFYFDCVLRHIHEKHPAVAFYDSCEEGWLETSYAALHDLVTRRARAWKAQGCKKGEGICLLGDVSLNLIVDLMAALRLGMVLSILPLEGRVFIERRLELLQPDYIAVDKEYRFLFSDCEPVLLHDETGGEGSAGRKIPVETESFSYVEGELFGSFFSQWHPLVHRPLCAESAYRHALRDALFSLGLAPGKRWAAPDFSVMELFPCAVLSSLLCGATYVHFNGGDVDKNPHLLEEALPYTLGIKRSLRELVLSREWKPCTTVKLWFRNPIEDNDFSRWEGFRKVCGFNKVPMSNLIFDPAGGRNILFSSKSVESFHNNVQACPGVPWQIQDVVRKGQEALGGVGLFSHTDRGGKAIYTYPIMLAKNDSQWMYSGMNLPHRRGRVLSEEAVLIALEKLPWNMQASVVTQASLEHPGSALTILLLFSGGIAVEDESTFCLEVVERGRNLLKRELGEDYLPDKIEVFPLQAREEKGQVDHEWCRMQYLNGFLDKKSERSVYCDFTTLRHALHGASVKITF